MSEKKKKERNRGEEIWAGEEKYFFLKIYIYFFLFQEKKLGQAQQKFNLVNHLNLFVKTNGVKMSILKYQRTNAIT